MIPLKVNGATRDVASGRLLLSALHDELALASVRYGCGVGACGACTVLVDGKPLSSCLLFTEQAAGHELVTVEGLGTPERLHRVQRAFLDAGAFQCAYCTPGFILATVALLEEHPAPTEAEAREYLAGQLCRCGSYPAILRAVLSLAEPPPR
jgi:aerobic-type carbon monoxide dehydrogenase small subunit (CoxS/CutS family)